jgi:hypothetical protein
VPDRTTKKPRLARIPEEHRLLVGAGRVADPLDLGRGLEVHRGAVDVAGPAARRYREAQGEQGERADPDQCARGDSSKIG